MLANSLDGSTPSRARSVYACSATPATDALFGACARIVWYATTSTPPSATRALGAPPLDARATSAVARAFGPALAPPGNAAMFAYEL